MRISPSFFFYATVIIIIADLSDAADARGEEARDNTLP